MRTIVFAIAFAAALTVFSADAHASSVMKASPAPSASVADSDGGCARSHGRGARGLGACGSARLFRTCEIDVRAVAQRFARGQRRHGHTANCA